MSLRVGSNLPSFAGATEWLNGQNYDVDLYSGPILVQFWAISCPSCKRNIPGAQRLQEQYAFHGLRLVSVHMPRLETDIDVEKVKIAIEEFGLIGPCAVDNNHTLGDLFQTGGVWPYYFLFDSEGRLRSRAAGELGLKIAENSLKRMFGVEQETPQESLTV